MAQLALIRHGDLVNRELSPMGERQADAAGQWLRGQVGEDTAVRIITSPAPRARKGASILCSHLGLKMPQEEPRLWSGPDGVPDSWDEDPDGLVDQVLEWSRTVELLVVVTHYEICASLPLRLSARLGVTGRIPGGLARGEGWWLDLDSLAWCQF